MKKLVNSLFDHLRQSEVRLAKSILRWKLQKEDSPLPEDEELNMAASQLLDEAREIARKRGKKLLEVLKEEAKEFFNSKPS
jgi:hypothetical protein